MSHQNEIQSIHTNAILKQQENAAITRTVNWINRLGDNTISSSTWALEDSGATISNESNTDYKATARITGDIGIHLITNQVVLSNGDTMEFQFKLMIKDNTQDWNRDYQ